MSPPPRSDLLALLRAVKAEPDDDTPKLVLADWLQEQDDPADVARGEWLRLCVERDRLVESDPRRAELTARSYPLWNEHRQAWFGPLMDVGWFGTPADFRWGLFYPFASQRFETGVASSPGGEVLAWTGGLRYEFNDRRGLTKLLRCPVHSSLVGLTLVWRGNREPLGTAEAVAGCERLTGLVQLNLSSVLVGPDGAAALSGSLCLGRLADISLASCRLGDAGFAALAASRSLERLRVLDASSNGLSIHAARAFVDSAGLPALTALNLGGNRIGPDGTLILVHKPAAGRLRKLGLRANGVADYGVEAICRQPHLNRLTHLDLSANLLTDRAATALVGADHLNTLEVLDLRQNQISDAGAATLRERFGARVLLD